MGERIFYVENANLGEQDSLKLVEKQSGHLSWGADGYAVIPTGDGGAVIGRIIHADEPKEDGTFQRVIKTVETKRLSPKIMEEGGWIWHSAIGVLIGYTSEEIHTQRLKRMKKRIK